MKCVPFNPQWLQMEGLDLHAIYRRPRRAPITGRILRDPGTGFVLYDVTGPLPIKSHQLYVLKQFEYITLASRQDVINAASPALIRRGVQPLRAPDRYLSQWDDWGPWQVEPYLAWQAAQDADHVAAIRQRVSEIGPVAAELFERQRDPEYVLPAALTGTPQPEPEPVPAQAPKRTRGRPKGSKNKPKAPSSSIAAMSVSELASSEAP